MKRTLKFSAIALLAVVVLWACGGGANGSAKDVGTSFLNAIAKGDVDGAKKLATKDAQTSLDMASATFESKKANPDKIEVGEIKEEGDKATLSYKENGTDKTLDLIKEDGKWKAAWSKGGGSTPAPEIEPEAEIESVDSGATEE